MSQPPFIRDATKNLSAHVCKCGHQWSSHTWTGMCRFETCACGCIDPDGPPVDGCGCSACFKAHEKLSKEKKE